MASTEVCVAIPIDDGKHVKPVKSSKRVKLAGGEDNHEGIARPRLLRMNPAKLGHVELIALAVDFCILGVVVAFTTQEKFSESMSARYSRLCAIMLHAGYILAMTMYNQNVLRTWSGFTHMIAFVSMALLLALRFWLHEYEHTLSLAYFMLVAIRLAVPPLAQTMALEESARRNQDKTKTAAYGILDVIISTLRHWSTQRTDLALCGLAVMIVASTNPGMAYFLAKISDAFEGQDTASDASALFTLGVAGLLALCVPVVLGNTAIAYVQSKMISMITERIQIDLLHTLLLQDVNFFAHRTEGDLNNLFTSDLARVNTLWQAVFWNLLNPTVAVVTGVGYAFVVDYTLGVILSASVIVLLSHGPQYGAAQRSKAFSVKNAAATSEFQNAIACHHVVRAYDIEEPLVSRFRKQTTSSLRQFQFQKDMWASVVQIWVASSMYVLTAILTASLALKVWHGEMRTGDFFGMMALLQRVSKPVSMLGGFMRVGIANASSLQRLDDVLINLASATEKDEDDDDLRPDLPPMEHSLSIDRLVFSYDKQSSHCILNEMSAEIPLGAYTCIVGPSGCGKSTLLACLMEFQVPDAGIIRVDGKDILGYSRKSYKNQLAVVFQDAALLNGSIYDNIRFGDVAASDSACEEAARWAECDSFIRELKGGYNAIVGQHSTAVRLSGGQAQRLCLARALCRRPRVLLLDEATSALDPETAAAIVSTLVRLAHEHHMTVILVTHNLAATVNADCIVVLNNGVVAESGRYAELTDAHGLFYDMLHQNEMVEEQEDPEMDTNVLFQRSSPGRRFTTMTVTKNEEEDGKASHTHKYFPPFASKSSSALEQPNIRKQIDTARRRLSYQMPRSNSTPLIDDSRTLCSSVGRPTPVAAKSTAYDGVCAQSPPE